MYVKSIICRRFVGVYLAFCILLSFAICADALTERMLTIRESFNAADAIVWAQIDDQEELFEGSQRCGIRYNATVLEDFKGELGVGATKKIMFGRDVGLARYRTYLLFLHREVDSISVYERLKEKFGFADNRENIMDLIRCKGTIPGYVFNPRMPWEILSGDVWIVGFLPDSFPPEIHAFSAETAVWLVPKDELFSYLRMLRHSP